MIVPKLNRWEAGDQPNDVMFNTLMDVVEFVNDPPQGHFTTGTSTPAMASGGWTPIPFTTVVKDREFEYDPLNPIWSVAAPTAFFIRTKGWYELELATSWPSATFGTSRRQHAIRINGAATTDYRARYDLRVDGQPMLRNAYDIYFDAGSYFELMAWQATGSSINLFDGGSTGSRTSVRMKWYSL